MKLKHVLLIKQATRPLKTAARPVTAVAKWLPKPSRHQTKSFGLVATASIFVVQMILSFLPSAVQAATISSTIDTSTTPGATMSSNQRKVDRTQNGNLWAIHSGPSTHAELWYSTNNGASWTLGVGTMGAMQNTSIFIDVDDYLHLVYSKDGSANGVYYKRGTPNAGRTSWSLSAEQTVSTDSAVGYPDVVAYRTPGTSPTQWDVAIVGGTAGNSTVIYAFYERIHISNSGTFTFDNRDGLTSFIGMGQLGGSYSLGASGYSTWPSIDFNHTGDGKTVADSAPHLYVAWSAGKTGSGFGLRYKKATYSGSAWSWGAEREIANDVYTDSSYWLNCLFDGDRVYIGGFFNGTTSLTQALWERDVSDTTTTQIYKQGQTSGSGYFAGSMTYDESGNVYFFGTSIYSGAADLGYRKWTRATNSMSTRTTIDASVPDASTRNIGVSAKRGQSNNRIELVYTDGTSSPYNVNFWSKNAFDVTLTSPATGASIYFNQPQTFSWDYVGDGTQAKYALRRRSSPVTYNSTGSQQAYVVPSGVTSIKLKVWGAKGGELYTAGNKEPGYGGYAEGTLSVTPGETLNVYVGGAPASTTGGFNGGGNGAGAHGSAGGGASDVRQGGTALSNRVIVAGGGGGVGAPSYYTVQANGGNGGGTTGNSAESPGGVGSYGAGGGGTQSAGGTGGAGATAGSLGQGGSSAGGYTRAGAGGGGGYYGGGGGGSGGTGSTTDSAGGSGGGGSGYIGGVTNGVMTNGVNTSDGIVIVEPSYEWWNASTSQWVTTETWNSSATESVTFPANSWTEGNFEWSVAVENGSAVQSEYSSTRSVTFVDAPPSAPTLLYPGNGSAVNFGNNQRFSWTFNDSGDTQSAYALKRKVQNIETVSKTETFSYTGAAQQWTVPAYVTSIEIETWGAAGATSTGSGGLGGYSKGTLSVSEGETLRIYVGGAGSLPGGTAGCTGSTNYGGGGWNGGGNGAGNQREGGGGGGATDIRQGGTALSNRVIVAGGGGGGANGVDTPGYNGGGGGGSSGDNAANGGGTGGTQVNGGTSGGSLGQGGTGGTDNCNRGGGGGGGGYYGGGGGAGGSTAYGGGGGSGYIGGVTGGSMQNGVRSGNGQVKITYNYETSFTKNELPISSQIDTSTGSTATAYSNQRKLDFTQNNVLWTTFWNGTSTTTASMEFWYSTDNGATWNNPGSSSYFGFNGTNTTYAPSISFFIDLDDYAHVAYKDRHNGIVYYRRGTPNAARTAWTWSSASIISTTFGWQGPPDIIAHREGAGWVAHIVWMGEPLTSPGSSNSTAMYRPVTISSGGTITVGSGTGLWSVGVGASYNPADYGFPSIDFNHTGDAKTVAGNTPHLYVAWSSFQAGASSNFNGIKFKKASYSGGTWTWGTEREIDSTRYSDGFYRVATCIFDGTRVVIGGSLYNGSTVDLMLYERDAADATTTTRLLANHSAVSSTALYSGNITYDDSGNIYFFGGENDSANGYSIGYRKWSRSGASLGSWVQVGGNVSITGSNLGHASAKRGSAGNKIAVLFTDGTGSPYPVRFYGLDINSIPPTLTTVDTSTASTATYRGSQRSIDRTQNGVLWTSFWNGTSTSTTSMEFWYSTDNGVTWNDPGSSSYFGFAGFGTTYTPNSSFFIDIDDYAHVTYKDRANGYIYYRRGTPNAGRTAWTWSSALAVQNAATAWDYPDMVVNTEGTGWVAHIVWSHTDGVSTTTKVSYRNVTIASNGSTTLSGIVTVGSVGVANTTSAAPSIDFNHAGNGKTTSGGTPHLYVSWYAGNPINGQGIRFRKATYSSGPVWTWGTDREINATQSISSSVWMNSFFDGTRVVIAGYSAEGNRFIFERDAADTTTTQQLMSAATADAGELHVGGATYDSDGNIYLFGSNYTTLPTDLSFYKWTRATSTLGQRTSIEFDAQNTWWYPSVLRGSSGTSVEMIYTDGQGSPYSIKYWGYTPKTELGTEEWWNATTSSWDGTEVWNTSTNSYADFAPGAWTLDTNYQWSVATKDSGGKVGAYSGWSGITVPEMTGMMRHGQFFTESGGDQSYYFRWFGN